MENTQDYTIITTYSKKMIEDQNSSELMSVNMTTTTTETYSYECDPSFIGPRSPGTVCPDDFEGGGGRSGRKAVRFGGGSE